VTWPKYQILKIQHFENGFIAIFQPGIIRFRWNLVCRLTFWFQERSRADADSRHIENRILAISPRVIVRLTRAVFGIIQVELCLDTRHVTKIAIFKNSRWRMAAILTMVSALYLSRGSSDFNEIWCATADFGSKDGHVTKCQIQNGERPPYWKSFFGYILTIYCPINVKFDTKKQNYVQIQVTWPKYQNLKIQDSGRPEFWKWFYHYISPISMRFGVPLHNLVPRTVNY